VTRHGKVVSVVSAAQQFPALCRHLVRTQNTVAAIVIPVNFLLMMLAQFSVGVRPSSFLPPSSSSPPPPPSFFLFSSPSPPPFSLL
jgi:hypothetical protein